MQELTIRRAIVTGGTGAVGVALCQRLLAEGIKVWAVANPASRRIANLPQGVHVIPCDIGDLASLPELIDGAVDAFFHLGWAHTIGPGRHDAAAQTDNIRCAVQAVRAAAALGCSVFVGVGSQAEHGAAGGLITPDTPCYPINAYGIAKLCAGQMTRLECSRLGIRHCWVRLLSVYGPHDGPLSVIPTIITTLLRGEKPSLTAGEPQWDFLYAGDAAQALLRVAQAGRDRAIYPLGSGKTRQLREYFSIVRDAIDPSLPLGLGELPYPPGQVMHLQADLTTLTADTGFIPTTAFEDGIRLTIESFRQEELL